MKRLIQILAILVLLAILGLAMWFGLKQVIEYFKKTDSKLVASIVTASTTILVGIGAVILSQNRIKKREILEAHRASKIKLYTRFNEFLFKVITGENDSTSSISPTALEMADFMALFKQDLLFIASPKVIKAYIEYEVKSGKTDNKILLYMDDLLMTMRKDIGLGNLGLRDRELIQIFLTEEGKKTVKRLRK